MMQPHRFTTEELEGFSRDELDLIVLARGVDPGEGTGANGNVVVGDLIDAIIDHQDATGLNPALEATVTAEATVPKRYRVVGGSTVYDTPPGGEFERALPPAQEAMLLEGGAIVVVGSGASKVVAEEPIIEPIPDTHAPSPFAITPAEQVEITAGMHDDPPLMTDEAIAAHVADSTVDQLVRESTGDALLAKRYLAAEQARDDGARTSLVRDLQHIITTEKETQ